MLATWAAACGGGDEPGPEDAPDASPTDAAQADAAGPDATPTFVLSAAGLYADIATRTVVPEAIEYTPAFPLWSDTAVKRRWLVLPPDTVIDTSDVDHWEFPPGAKLFKQFERDGVVVETRMIERTGPGPDDYLMGAFIWLDDDSDAVFEPRGQRNAHGTEHDVPSEQQCIDCHQGEPGRVLGLSAVQLASAAPPNLATLATAGLLVPSVTADDVLAPPGDALTRAAFGYLHANCGSCHTPGGSAFEDVSLVLRLASDEAVVETTGIYTTNVDVALERFDVPPFDTRVVPGDSAASALHFRMSVRTLGMEQMPPIGSELVDADGVEAVRAWIDSLPVADEPPPSDAGP